MDGSGAAGGSFAGGALPSPPRSCSAEQGAPFRKRDDDYRRLAVSAQALHKRGDAPVPPPKRLGPGSAAGAKLGLKLPEKTGGMTSPTRVQEQEKKYVDGSRYLGQLSRDDRLPDGFGELVLDNGVTRYEGQWRDGEMHGHGLYWWDNEDSYEGTFYKGLMHGRGVFAYCQEDTRVAAVKKVAFYRHGQRIAFLEDLCPGRRIRIQRNNRLGVDDATWLNATVLSYREKTSKHAILFDYKQEPKHINLATVCFEICPSTPLNRCVIGGTDADKYNETDYALRPSK